MRFIYKNFFKKILKCADSANSLRKQLSGLIRFCCILAISIQAMILLAIIFPHYAQKEKEDTLYVLESTHANMNLNFQYLEEIVLTLQNHTGLLNYFDSNTESPDSFEQDLKNAANLFSERNLIGPSEPFVEKVYLYNLNGDSIYHLYYPALLSEIKADQQKYHRLYNTFLESKRNFYCRTSDDYIDLCLWLYDSNMTPLGICIFTLNKSAIENNYKNIESFGYYCWELQSSGEIIAGNKNPFPIGWVPKLEHSLKTGFGLTLYSNVSFWIIYQSLGITAGIMLLISAVLITLLSLFGHSVAVRYVQPLETIAEKISLVGKGNFDAKLQEYDIEELKNISYTFNEMTDYINRLIKEVYETQLIAQQAQIQYLQSQINPHFLSNALSMIKIQATYNGDKEVQDMLYNLSKLYQGKIFRKNEYFIPLSEEMEIIYFYLSLQNNRFKEKITFSISYDGKEADFNNLLVPRLSIEPIVENAFLYGLQPKPGNGSIHILISKTEDKLTICIQDDGVGFDPNSIIEKAEDKDHTHVGLWNTHKMIHNLCGTDYGLKIESKIGKGTTVYVSLPIKLEENHVESNGC